VRRSETCERWDSDEIDEEPDDQADLDESETERIYLGLLDLEPAPQARPDSPLWPEGWDEEKVWGDIGPSERRYLKRLLGNRAPKGMDT
jgi:hypothetical protein